MPDFVHVFLVNHWALMVHIVVAHVEKTKKKNTPETTIFLQESGFGFQWELFGHLYFLYFVVVVAFLWCLPCFGVLFYLVLFFICCCWFVAVVDLLFSLLLLLLGVVCCCGSCICSSYCCCCCCLPKTCFLLFVFCFGCFGFVFACLCFVWL